MPLPDSRKQGQYKYKGQDKVQPSQYPNPMRDEDNKSRADEVWELIACVVIWGIILICAVCILK